MSRRWVRAMVMTAVPLLLGLGCSSDDDAPRADSGGRADATVDQSSGDGGAELCQRWVLEPEVRNARDLGGWAVAGGKRVKCRRFYHGGDLTALTSKGCAAFEQLGFETVIDLRAVSEQQAQPNAACVAATATTVTAALPKLLPDSPENYVALLDAGEGWKAMFEALAQESRYPIYLHCIIGRDRAGLAGALVMLALGADRATAAQEFLLSAQAAVPVPVKEESLNAFLDELGKRGGVEAYLTSIGITAEQLSTIRALLTE